MSHQFNYLFVSDLHLSEGVKADTGKLHRNEDFFHDVSFANFLNYHVQLSHDKALSGYYQVPWKLVINGDLFDFLQVVSMPPVSKEGVATMAVMNAAGTAVAKQKKLSHNEKTYGLGTSEPEIVWKLNLIYEGHPLFFQALAWFVATGNHLVIMKGNHDIELFWPAVQTALRHILVEAYETWHQAAHTGEETRLHHYPDLPSALSLDDVAAAVAFPATYYYEKEIFYIEHGCQYDPSNWFPNFEDPRLPSHKEYLELPSGSLFVRYFFNGVENIHPFADNIKPISRYIFWLFRNAPASAFLFLTKLLPNYLRGLAKVREKKGYRPEENRQPANSEFEKELFKIQKSTRENMLKGGRQTSIRMFFSIVLILISVILGLTGIRLLSNGNYLWMIINFIGAIAAYVGSSYLFMSLDGLLGVPFLHHAAIQINQLLNKSEPDTIAPVPYLIFGHDHSATIELLPVQSSQANPNFKQWYVNTGAWVPVFSEEERLLRDDEHLTFFRIVSQHLDRDQLPELLQWSPEANQPLPVRLFD